MALTEGLLCRGPCFHPATTGHSDGPVANRSLRWCIQLPRGHGGKAERAAGRAGATPGRHEGRDPSVPAGSRAAVEKAYDELSAESRFHRFLSAVPHLTDSMFRHLVEEVDGVDHIALFLVLEPDEGPESIIGVARIIRYQDEPTSADVAVTIRDQWHGQGAATALLAALMRQRPAGVTRIVTVVSADNAAATGHAAAAGILRRHSRRPRHREGGGGPAATPDSACGSRCTVLLAGSASELA